MGESKRRKQLDPSYGHQSEWFTAKNKAKTDRDASIQKAKDATDKFDDFMKLAESMQWDVLTSAHALEWISMHVELFADPIIGESFVLPALDGVAVPGIGIYVADKYQDRFLYLLDEIDQDVLDRLIPDGIELIGGF